MNVAFWLTAWVAASLPWRSSGIFGIAGSWPKLGGSKPLWLTLLESLALYSAVFAVMFTIEAQRGQRASQTWQFWAIMVSLWIVLAFPAAAWFKLRKI